MLVDIRLERSDASLTLPEALAAELACCLERFLDGTADEGIMSRAHTVVEVWKDFASDGLRPLTTTG